MRRLIERAEAAFRAGHALVVPGIQLAAGTLAYLASTAVRMGGWGVERGVELAVLIGAGALIAAGLWQEPWLGAPLGLAMFAAPWIIGRLARSLTVGARPCLLIYYI